MNKYTVLMLSCAAMLAATTASANDHEGKLPPQGGAPHGKMHGGMFKETDSNGDGGIDKAEWQAKGDRMFAEIDANKDGKISHDEMKAHHEQKREERKERHEERKERREEMKEKMGERMEKKGEKPAEAPTAAH